MQKKYDNNNVFAKILRGEIPCNKIYEDDYVLAFEDIDPKSPVHILLITKESFVSFDDFMQNANKDLVNHFFSKVRDITRDFGVENNYRIVSNHGEDAGQVVFHFHLHIMGYK